MLQLIGGRQEREKKRWKKTRSKTIFTTVLILPRVKSSAGRDARRAAVERGLMDEGGRGGGGGIKKREGNTFKSGIRSEPEETRRNAIIAAKDNLTGGSFPPRLLFAVRPRFFLLPLLAFLFLIHFSSSSRRIAIFKSKAYH